MKQGVLLVNLGSPDSTEVGDVKKYLDQFLMDKRVIDYPYLLRALLVKGIILRTRPPRSAAAYKKVWTDEGSPLIVYTQKLTQKVRAQQNIEVDYAMRYGNPSIPNTIQALYNKGVRDLYVIPLYPQYAMSTTQTVMEEVHRIANKLDDLKITSHPPFYNDPNYLEVLANSLRPQIPEDFDKILFSFHGLPERHIYKTDPTQTCRIDGTCCFEAGLPSHATCYRHQCYSVAHQLAERLNIDTNKMEVAFQSRLGRDKWLEPSTDQKVEELTHHGVKKLVVASPAFVADCLETLEELNMELRKEFLENGGEDFYFLSCLNDNDDWANTLNLWINQWKS